jgi:hypothetical protein
VSVEGNWRREATRKKATSRMWEEANKSFKLRSHQVATKTIQIFKRVEAIVFKRADGSKSIPRPRHNFIELQVFVTDSSRSQRWKQIPADPNRSEQNRLPLGLNRHEV